MGKRRLSNMSLEERMTQQANVGLTQLIIGRAQKLLCNEIFLTYHIPSGSSAIRYKDKRKSYDLFGPEYKFSEEARTLVDRPIVLQTCMALLKVRAGLDYQVNSLAQIGSFHVRSMKYPRFKTEVTVSSTVGSRDNIPYEEFMKLNFRETNEKYVD